MSPTVAAFAVPAAFVAGVVFHKYVISEAEKVKSFVQQSEARIRADVQVALQKLASKG